MRTEKDYLPQIRGDMVSLHNMVSPQNDDTRGEPPPSNATVSVLDLRLFSSLK